MARRISPKKCQYSLLKITTWPPGLCRFQSPQWPDARRNCANRIECRICRPHSAPSHPRAAHSARPHPQPRIHVRIWPWHRRRTRRTMEGEIASFFMMRNFFDGIFVDFFLSCPSPICAVNFAFDGQKTLEKNYIRN